MRFLPLLSVLTLAGSCAHPRAPVGPSESAAAMTAAEQQLARDEAELRAPAAAGHPVDCIRARTLRDNICVLADKICVLVERDRTIPEGPIRCQKARVRCQKARVRCQNAPVRVSGACGDR
jgi:hypothetical protein